MGSEPPFIGSPPHVYIAIYLFIAEALKMIPNCLVCETK